MLKRARIAILVVVAIEALLVTSYAFADVPYGMLWVLGEGAILFFHAHLDRYAPGLSVGDRVARGTLLGFVGDTGNARGIPHLHFEARPAATIFAPIDPDLVLGPKPPTLTTRLEALASSLPEHR